MTPNDHRKQLQAQKWLQENTHPGKDFLTFYLDRYHAETLSDKQFNNALKDFYEQ